MGEKYELILTPEGDKVKLFELVYFQKHAPKEVLEHWNILVGRQPLQNIGLRTEDGWDISGEDVQIWLEEQGENSFAISACCEKLLPILREEEGRAWCMLTTLSDQVLGEIHHMTPLTAKSCCLCSGRRKAGPGGCSPPSPIRCWVRFPT